MNGIRGCVDKEASLLDVKIEKKETGWLLSREHKKIRKKKPCNHR